MAWRLKPKPESKPKRPVTVSVLFRNGWKVKWHRPGTVTESDDAFRFDFSGETTIVERDAVAYVSYSTAALEEGGDDD